MMKKIAQWLRSKLFKHKTYNYDYNFVIVIDDSDDVHRDNSNQEDL